eukprot:CAMPEP_0115827524 /NCGR_PEP_ID=MMETSP0287-20121206/90_1 /TAXON_ID=412157 /ORGANISM="Chrysochromulina rotalis, Strain UIO044" /LENGTH=411 /DNA_ID=CAMNT_0003280687 /DNA_START=11 /DNA_END=1246 /DNA_ORIENTATION=-
MQETPLVFSATFFAGLSQGMGQFYRFAAMEVCAPTNRPVAVTLVLSGGVIAAFAGPELGLRTANIFGDDLKYLCSFVAVGVMGVLNAVLCSRVSYPPRPQRTTAPLLDVDRSPTEAPELPRPWLSTLMLQPRCVLAVSIATLAHTSMVMIMSPLVIAMAEAGFPEQITTITLEAHFFSMFAPGFLTGKVIGHIGPPATSLLGIATFGGAAGVLMTAVSYSGTVTMISWAAGMALCGLAWNLCFSSGTVMLATCYAPEDAARVQGANDFVIFAIAGIGSFGSGYIYKSAGDNVSGGWHALILVVIALMSLLLLLLATLTLHVGTKQGPPASSAAAARSTTSIQSEAHDDGADEGAQQQEYSSFAHFSRESSMLSVVSHASTATASDVLRASVQSEAVFLAPDEEGATAGAVE